MSPPYKIQKGLKVNNSTHQQGYNSVPESFTWSNNSCAYDSVLTVLFFIWNSDNPQHDAFSDMTSNVARILQQTFSNITDNQEYEKYRDIFRHALETIDFQNHRFGEVVSVGSLLNHLLATEYEITRIHNRCSNNHTEHVHSISSGHFQAEIERHKSIQHWVNVLSSHTHRKCRQCSQPYAQFVDLLQIIAFEVNDKSTILDQLLSVRQTTGSVLKYRLAGIIYFGDMHFVAHIIRQDGQIWFHDGITTHCNLIYEGSVASGQINLSSSHSKDVHTGIYCCI